MGAPTPEFVLLPAATKLWPRLFLHVCVILFTGGGLRAGRIPPDRESPPGQADPPGADTPQPGSRHPPEQNPPRADTPPGSTLQHTVNEWPVRILLECILVLQIFCRKLHENERICTPWGHPWNHPWIRQWHY